MMVEAALPRLSTSNHAGVSGGARLHALIADHDGFARSTMCEALRGVDKVGSVTTAGDGREAMDLARYYRPGVLVVDTALPPDGGVELIGKVLDSTPETRVVTVSVGDDEAAPRVDFTLAGAGGDESPQRDSVHFLTPRPLAGEAFRSETPVREGDKACAT